MNTYIFDCHAVMTLLQAEAGFHIVEEILLKVASGNAIGMISSINVGELYYMTCRKSNEKKALMALRILNELKLQIVEPKLSDCIAAAKFKVANKLSYADAFAATLSIVKKGYLVTGDPEFKNLKKDLGLKLILIRE